ncbi:MAG: glycosyltransferase family 2 protein [Gemmatimonadaceae bacterium]|nr:glycosyltransferase family 2 protein [Gemmatimonadaceae bacterium]MCW5827473.1 glycosyltransferase family 2 protein [Gemmatimonadaceae bacterium]
MNPYASVAIIIPCFRVERHIAGVIRSIPEQYRTIICVDDASPDTSAAVIQGLGDPRVILVRHARNLGVGGAVKTGYAEAMRRGAGICVKMDGDGQMSAEDLDALVAPLLDASADYAKGNRFVDLTALRQMPTVRLVGNALLTFASKCACGYWNMLDVSNGFTAISAGLLRRLDLARISDRYFFETSMLIELNILRAAVADVSMPARYGDERSSLRISRVLATFPALLVRGLARRLYWRYVIEDFGVASVCAVAGIPLLLFGTSFGAVRWLETVSSGTPATAGTVLVAALPIIVGFQLVLAAVLLDVLSSPTAKHHRDRP